MTVTYLTRAELFAEGHTRGTIRAALRRGELLHVRRDRYLATATHELVVQAVRVGGRLTCLSLLESLGIFVLRNDRLHVEVARGASRLRAPHDRKLRISALHSHGVKLHWTVRAERPGSTCVVDLIDALAHAVRCQPPRAAVATLDSALYNKLIEPEDLAAVFERLPARYHVLRTLVDGQAESGTETLIRLIARQLGCDVRLQVSFDGIGRVDLVLDGWLVVECDSKAFHSDWEQQLKDRRRDVALAALGYCTLRLTAADILYNSDTVLAALRGLIQSRRCA